MFKKTVYLTLLLVIGVLMIGCNNISTTEQTTTEISTSSDTTTTATLYEVIFNSMGGTQIDSLYLPVGSSIDLPTVEKEGYALEGWYYDEDFSVQYSSTTMPAQDINLYANWTLQQYSIEYYSVLPKLNSDETILSTFFAEGHSSAITSEGRLFMWGDNYKGKLGNGSTSNQYAPIDITSQFNLNSEEMISSVSLGDSHSAAITSEGRLFTWGYNYHGQLGDNTTTDRDTPTDITSQFDLNGEETMISVSLGAYHSAALSSEGRLFVWGWNNYGQLGNGTTTDQMTPTNITSQFSLNAEETITRVFLGDYHSSAITSEGRVFTWGYNSKGQLGDNTTTDKLLPTDITSQLNLNIGESVISASLGEEYSCAVTSLGRLFTWGNNTFGQLGDTSTTNSSTPTDITSQFELINEEMIVAASLGGDHSSAITSVGRIFTWGYNFSGQLGDDTRTNQHTPKDITSQFTLSAGETILSVSLGRKSSSAVTTLGRTFTWGYNAVGQLGDGTIYNIKTPYNLLFITKTLLSSETLDYNVSIEEYIPSLEGYSFDGWYIDEALSTPNEFTTVPAQDINLYAKWIPTL